MSTSQGVNVLRWSALVAGIFYGFSHQRTITSNLAASHEEKEYKHRAGLIQKAKAEWAKKNSPSQAKSSGSDIIEDTNDSKFDLGAYIDKYADK